MSSLPVLSHPWLLCSHSPCPANWQQSPCSLTEALPLESEALPPAVCLPRSSCLIATAHISSNHGLATVGDAVLQVGSSSLEQTEGKNFCKSAFHRIVSSNHGLATVGDAVLQVPRGFLR